MNIENYLIKDKDITDLSNFKTKAKAKYYFELNNIDDIEKIKAIYEFGANNTIPVLIIGGGTNLLFAFDIYDGIIINNCLNGWNYDKKTKILESYSNENISDIAKSLYNNGQILWKRFIGLPGSIGGAIFGNAGCFGLETENNFLEADVLNLETGKIEKLGKKEMAFDYRNSIIKKTDKYFIIKVRFDLNNLVEKYSSDIDNIDFRENKQPKGNSCGSFFKNPSKEKSAGFLIEKVGLKGYNIGGAYFSVKHSNFLMTNGDATYNELLDLIHLAKEKVKTCTGIEIIPEVRIIYN